MLWFRPSITNKTHQLAETEMGRWDGKVAHRCPLCLTAAMPFLLATKNDHIYLNDIYIYSSLKRKLHMQLVVMTFSLNTFK